MCAECDATSQVRRKELALVMGYTVGGALLCLLSRMGVFVWCGPRAKTPEKEAERSKHLEEWIAKDREVVAQHGGYPYRPEYATIISKCASPWLLECPHCHQEFQHRDTYAQQFTMERPTRCPNPRGVPTRNAATCCTDGGSTRYSSSLGQNATARLVGRG